MTKVLIQSKKVSVVILREKCNDNTVQILQLKRNDQVYKGLWTHIYGGVKEYEKAWETAKREVFEETSLKGFNLYSAEYCEQFYVIKTNSISIVPVFIAVISNKDNIVLNNEHSSYKWCSLSDAIRNSKFPEQSKLYTHIDDFFDIKKPLKWTYINASNLEKTVEEMEKKKIVNILYKNYRGETALRQVVPKKTWFGSTDWHPEEQWLLDAYDIEKEADRSFAMKDIQSWFVE